MLALQRRKGKVVQNYLRLFSGCEEESLLKKVNEAISFLRENEPEEGYILKFSGGKDSIVMYDIVKKSGVRFEAFYNFTSLDPPEVLSFMKRYYPEVKWIRPYKGRSFWYWLERVGPPTKAKRWCCTKLKHAARSEEAGRKVLVGVRADESWKRAKRGRIAWNQDGRNWVLAPIFHFKEEDVWLYIEKENLPYPTLYDEGFNRVACVVCPFITGSEKLLERHKERWGKFYEKFESVVRVYFERKREFFESVGVSSFEEYMERWYSGVGVGREQECEESLNGELF